MGLLAPLFLLGALAVAVPILVHLVHRERKQPLAFPSLMFLRRVPFRSAKRQRIRYWLLFLLRTAALLLVAAAFARPWLESTIAPLTGASGGKDIVVMVDRSYSMSARGVWPRAQKAVEQVIEDAEHGDRIAVIAFGEQAQLLARLDESRARAQVALRSIGPGADVTRYAPAFKLAGSALSRARGAAEIVVITDRQRSGWRGMEQVGVPANTTVRVVDVQNAPARNLAVSELTVMQAQSPSAQKRQRVVASARVLNRGAAAATVPVELRIDGRVQQARQVAVPAHGAAVVQFDPLFADGAAGEIRLRASDDVAADDVAFFTTDVRSAPVVRLAGGAETAFFFEAAITAGDAPFELHRSGARLGTADIADIDVVVFLDVALPTGAVAQRLAEFVRQGGGVIVAGTAARQAHDLLPVRGGTVRESEATPASLVSIDNAHPVFAAFRATGDQPFAAARITRHLRTEASDDASVLARFDDGSPALVEQRFGRGRVLFFASGFSRAAGDLVLQPAFVPFAQQLVMHAAAGAHSARAFTVGQVIDVNAFAAADADAVVITPARERVRLAPATGARTLRIAEPGIYQIRGTAQGASTQLIAANVDIAESDFSTLPGERFSDAVMPRGQAPAEAAASLLPLEQEQQQSIWWYLLLVAFGLFLVETVLANRIATAWRT